MNQVRLYSCLVLMLLFVSSVSARDQVFECSTFLQEYNKLVSIKILKDNQISKLVGIVAGGDSQGQEWQVNRSFISLSRAQNISEVSQIIGTLRLSASTLGSIRYVGVYTLKDPVKQDPMATVALFYGKNHTLLQAGMVFKWLGAYRCE